MLKHNLTAHQCCSMQLDKPFHPIISFSNNCRGSKHEHFVEGGLMNTFCVSKNIVFSFYCRLTVTKRSSWPLIRDQRLLSHPRASIIGRKLKLSFENMSKVKYALKPMQHTELFEQPSVASQLSLQTHREQEAHRELLMKLLSSLQYLLWHTEEGSVT